MRQSLLLFLLVFCVVANAWGNQLEDETVTGTLVVPAGETLDLLGTITLDGATIEVDGKLHAHTGDPLRLTGTGQIRLNAPDGDWSYRNFPLMGVVIDSGIEILGQNGTRVVDYNTINLGTIAAVDGGAEYEAVRVGFTNGFQNQGLIEARSGGRVWITAPNEAFRAELAEAVSTGTVRALPGGIIRIQGAEIQSLDELGNVENAGGIFELYKVQLDNAGRTTVFTGGDWRLMAGTRIHGGTLSADAGGRISMAPYRYSNYTSSSPVELVDVTLASDIFVQSGGAISLEESLTFAGGGIRFEEGSGSLTIPHDDAPFVVEGTGSIVASTGSGTILAAGGVVTLPAGVTVQATDGTLNLRRPYDVLGGFDIAGPIEATGGTIANTYSSPVISRGNVSVSDGGTLSISGSWTNLGDLRVESGGVLSLYGDIDNQSTISIEDAVVTHRGGSVTGPGSMTITNSTVRAAASMSLAKFFEFDGTGVDRVVAASLNLVGEAISVGSVAGERWSLSNGLLYNGIVNSTGGGELTLASLGSIRDIELNADIRIPTDARLAVLGGLTGHGNIILEGGELRLATYGFNASVIPASVLDRVDLQSGTVKLIGLVGEVGETLRLRSGVEWEVNHLRSDVFRDVRVEADEDVTLRITGGYAASNHWSTFSEGVTLAVPTVIEDTGASVQGGLTLDDATITITNPSGVYANRSRLVFEGRQTLDGVGEIRFATTGDPGTPESPNVGVLESSSLGGLDGLTIGPGITVRASDSSGYIGRLFGSRGPAQPIPLNNQGKLLAENGHTLSLFVDEFEQTGTLHAGVNSTLVVHTDGFVNDGRLQVAGGLLHVTGDLVQSSVGVLDVELAPDLIGVTSVQVDGAAVIDGILQATLGDAYIPSSGDTFSLLSAAGGVTGTFGGTRLPLLADGLYWQVAIGAEDVNLHVFDGAVPGDYNSDGTVSAADFTLIRDHFGTDFDLPNEAATPGMITIEDYVVWTSQFGQHATNTATVPEPGSAMVLGAMLLFILRFRNSVRRSPVG